MVPLNRRKLIQAASAVGLLASRAGPLLAHSAVPNLPPALKSSYPLISSYDFASFLAVPSNLQSYDLCRAAASKPSATYLLISGGSGLGKTHLRHAVAHQWRQKFSALKVECLSSELFVYQVQIAVQYGRLESYIQWMAACDLLLLEHIHYLLPYQDALAVLNEVMNLRQARGAGMLFDADDSLPSPLATLQARMPALQGFVHCIVDRPVLKERLMLIDFLNHREAWGFSEDIQVQIASHCTRNIREMIGTAFRLQAYAVLGQRQLSASFVKGILDGSYVL